MVMTKKTYSPGGVAKKGDLFIYTNSSWKLIPLGDDGLGTVTSITAGAGLSITGGQITSDGQISIDASYTAQSGTNGRNGLMSSADKQIIETLSNVAKTGSYDDLLDKPLVPAIEQSTGTNPDAVISQSAVTELLNGKANSSHTHEQSDIVELENTLNGKSSITHSHGAITKEGKLLNDSGEIVDSNTFLYTLLDGTISSISGIPFNKVDELDSNFEARDVEISKIKSVLPTDGEDYSCTADMSFEQAKSYIINLGRLYVTVEDNTGWYEYFETGCDIVYALEDNNTCIKAYSMFRPSDYITWDASEIQIHTVPM